MVGSDEVWLADLAICGPRLIEISRSEDLLTDEETRRASTIADAGARDRWIAAHAVLHLALRKFIGRPIRFSSTAERASAKPRVADWSGDFSLAHSGDLVLVAVARQGPIGIDVEVRRDIRMDPHRSRLIEAAGAAVVGGPRVAGADDRLQTLSAWTRLEAIAKARGSGIGAVLEAIGIHDPGASEASAAAAARRLIDGGEALTISDLAVARFDAVAALAQSRGAAAPTLRELSGSLSSLVR